MKVPLKTVAARLFAYIAAKLQRIVQMKAQHDAVAGRPLRHQPKPEIGLLAL